MNEMARRAAAAAFAPTLDADRLLEELREIGSRAGIEESELRAVVADGWEMAVGIFRESRDRDAEEEHERLGWETFRSFRATYGLPERDDREWLASIRFFRDRFGLTEREIDGVAAQWWEELTAD